MGVKDIIIGLLGTGIAILILALLEGAGVLPFVGGAFFIGWGLIAISNKDITAVLDREVGRGAGITFVVFMLFLGLVMIIVGITTAEKKK